MPKLMVSLPAYISQMKKFSSVKQPSIKDSHLSKSLKKEYYQNMATSPKQREQASRCLTNTNSKSNYSSARSIK